MFQEIQLIWTKTDTFGWGRVDDVIMTSGERVGPFEVESKLVEHPAIAEAGVIGKPDPVRGEIIKAFIALRSGYEPTDELKEEIRTFVKKDSLHMRHREKSSLKTNYLNAKRKNYETCAKGVGTEFTGWRPIDNGRLIFSSVDLIPKVCLK